MAEIEKPTIVIIGCGIAGISAASKLCKAGFRDVRILEATSRSGGRIKTEKLGNYITEIGATFIHGPCKENPVFCLSRDYGLLDREALSRKNQAMDIGESPPWVTNWFSSSGQKLNAKQMDSALDMFDEIVDDTEQFKNQRETPWASVGDFVRSKVKEQATKKWKGKDESTRKLLLCAISSMMKFECCSSAVHSMDELDLAAYCMYKDLKGLDCTFPNGYEGLITKMMSELPSDLVTYNKPVHCIHWDSSESQASSVTVECEDGERIPADHVIVTVPLGYLKRHCSTLFSPSLPANKLQSIQNLGFGTCNKIYVEFESPWWDVDCDVIYLVWKDEEDFTDKVSDISKNWIRKMSAFTVLKPSESHSHVLCGWIAGHESEYMETLPEQEVKRAITELVRTFTGNSTIALKRILRSQWFNDPWTCGSYCHPTIGCSAKDLRNMMEPLPKKGSESQPLQVLFAGEATHPCYYSSVHGAVLSGWREADRLISNYPSINAPQD